MHPLFFAKATWSHPEFWNNSKISNYYTGEPIYRDTDTDMNPIPTTYSICFPNFFVATPAANPSKEYTPHAFIEILFCIAIIYKNIINQISYEFFFAL